MCEQLNDKWCTHRCVQTRAKKVLDRNLEAHKEEMQLLALQPDRRPTEKLRTAAEVGQRLCILLKHTHTHIAGQHDPGHLHIHTSPSTTPLNNWIVVTTGNDSERVINGQEAGIDPHLGARAGACLQWHGAVTGTLPRTDARWGGARLSKLTPLVPTVCNGIDQA